MKPSLSVSWATKLLETFVPRRTSEALAGDLREQYERGRTGSWYCRQVLWALVIAAFRELRVRTFQAGSAITIGCGIALPLCYLSTSLAAQLVDGYKAYLVFLPLVFVSAAVSGRVVGRIHSQPMVLVYAGFTVLASVVAFVVFDWLVGFDRMPLPILAFFVASDFIVGPIGVLAGGLLGSPRAHDPVTS